MLPQTERCLRKPGLDNAVKHGNRATLAVTAEYPPRSPTLVYPYGQRVWSTQLGVTGAPYNVRWIKSFLHSAIPTSIWLLCVFSGSSVTARHNELVDQLCFPSINNAAARTAQPLLSLEAV